MRLSDKEILAALSEGRLVIAAPKKDLPFIAEQQVQPASIDLRLDNVFRAFKDEVKQIDIKDLSNVWDYLDTFLVERGNPIKLEPGSVLFGQIYEQIRIPDDVSGKIVGRSRFARMGLSVHATGDYINPEFEGAMPLQIINHNRIPIIIYPYLTICQLILVKLTSKPNIPYSLRTSNPYNREAIASPSVLNQDPALYPQEGDIIHAEIEKRMLDRYLKEIDAEKMAERIKDSIGVSNFINPQVTGTIIIKDSNIGVINPGNIAGEVKVSINLIEEDQENEQLKTALLKITDTLESNSDNLMKQDFIRAMEITKQLAQYANEKNNKSLAARLRPLIFTLGELLQSFAAGIEIWRVFGPAIKTFFGI